MNKQEAIKSIDSLLERLNVAEKIANKVDKELPEGWSSDFVIGNWQGLIFVNVGRSKSESSKMDFHLVCNLVKTATNTEVDKSPFIAGDFLFALDGICHYEYAEGKKLQITVRQCNTTECKLEFEEKVVKTAKLSEGCLQLTSQD